MDTMLKDQLALIVEDSLVNRVLLQHWLHGWGMQVGLAASLAEAQHWLDKHRPVIALVDFQLPDGDGSSLLPAIRAAGCETVIGMTLFDDEMTPALAKQAGFDAVLGKPIDQGVLRQVIHVASSTVPETCTSANAYQAHDAHGALQRLGGDRDLLRALIVMFRDAWPATRLSLIDAQADIHKQQRDVHTLAGQCAQIGLFALAELLQDSEKQLASQQSEARLHSLQQLAGYIDEALASLPAQA